MSKIVTAIMVSAFCFIAACGGGTPADKMASHMDKVISLLEANKTDAKKAGEAVTAYMKENEAALKADMEAVEKWGDEMEKKYKDDPEGGAKAKADMMAKMEPLMTRMQKLQQENPDLMKDDAVREAMRAMR